MMDISEDASVSIPEFLNNKTFKDCLENGLGRKGIEVIDTKLVIASKPGENYTSTIYGTTVTYKEADGESAKVANLLVKSIVMDEAKEFFDRAGTINKELDVYRELLPKIHKIIGNTMFSPKCYHIFLDPCRNLVFDDMKALGYKIADREVGLNEEHIKVALEKIAQFHAVSMVLLKEDPTIEENYKDGFFNKVTLAETFFESILEQILKLAAKIATKIPGLEQFEDKLIKFYENFSAIALNAMRFDSSKDIKVLNHGDLWVNNFLFKYDEETKKPVDIVYVDFQGTCFNSPGIDINYLFITSATLDIVKKKYEFVEKYYYPSLAKTLENLNFPRIPSLAEILGEVRKREMYTVMCLFVVLPFVSMDSEESKTNDMTQFLDKETSNRKILVGMSSQRFMDILKYTLTQLEDVIDEALAEYEMVSK